MHARRLVCDCKDYEVTAGSQLFQFWGKYIKKKMEFTNIQGIFFLYIKIMCTFAAEIN